MSKTFKTEKGTELPILNLKGKDYLEVKWRVLWFREDHPSWAIETEFVKIGDDFAIAKATIRDESGRIISTGQKHENRAGFMDYHEKAESGAIGRALGFLGYGTQFTDDLEEGERVVDSPIDRKPQSKPAAKAAAPTARQQPKTPDVFNDVNYGEYACDFGKHSGKKIKDFGEHDLDGFVTWLNKQANRSPSANIFLKNAESYLAQLEFERAPR